MWREVRDGDERVLCDPFAGTGAVGRHFRGLGFTVVAGDLQYYAYALNRAYLELEGVPCFAGLAPCGLDGLPAVLAHLNALPPVEGFVARHYGPIGGRLYYSAENAGRADAVRLALEAWRSGGLVTEGEFFYLLACLLEGLDAVANTASVYAAYLKRLKASARRPLTISPLELPSGGPGQAHHRDANDLVGEIECDLLYLDPPYNGRQYGANYHVLETVARHDAPVLGGLTGMRDYERSRYCRRGEAKAALAELVLAARTRHILVSYNDEGLMSLEDVREVLSSRGEPRTFETAHNRFKADNGRDYKRDSTIEYVHYVRVARP